MLKEVGRVEHYYPKLGVVIIELTASLRVGDQIRIIGFTTDFEQKVESMEIEHAKMEKARRGDSIGLKVIERARTKDVVYKILAS